MSTNISQSSENQSLTQQKIERLQLSVRKGWTPPPRISVPQWADDYRKLAKEAGSTSGNWETSTVEIARGPMLAATESGVHIITVMCCTQLMKTALLENLFGYFAHLDPCPILLLQPKEEAAEQFSKERISPLVRVTPVLRNIIGCHRYQARAGYSSCNTGYGDKRRSTRHDSTLLSPGHTGCVHGYPPARSAVACSKG